MRPDDVRADVCRQEAGYLAGQVGGVRGLEDLVERPGRLRQEVLEQADPRLDRAHHLVTRERVRHVHRGQEDLLVLDVEQARPDEREELLVRRAIT